MRQEVSGVSAEGGDHMSEDGLSDLRLWMTISILHCLDREDHPG